MQMILWLRDYLKMLNIKKGSSVLCIKYKTILCGFLTFSKCVSKPKVMSKLHDRINEFLFG